MVSISTRERALRVVRILADVLMTEEFRDLMPLAGPLMKLLLGIAFLESRFTASARNANSTAEGIWQLVRASRPLHPGGYSDLPNSSRIREQAADALRLVRKWRRFDKTSHGEAFRKQALRQLCLSPSPCGDAPSLASAFLKLLGFWHGSPVDGAFLLMLPIHWSIGGSILHITQGVRYLRRLASLLSGRG